MRQDVIAGPPDARNPKNEPAGRYNKGVRCLLFLLLAATTALGDVIHLKNGGRIEGKIVSEGSGEYRVVIASGTVVVPKADVVKIEYGPSPADELEVRKKALDIRDGAAVAALAKWADAKGFHDEALALARSNGDCRAVVIELIEPDVRSKRAEAARVLRLGLVRRARQILEEAAAKYPEARERLTADAPTRQSPRPRYATVNYAARMSRVESAVNAYFETGAEFKEEAPIGEVLAAIRRGARGSGRLDPGTHRRKTPDGVPYLLRVPSKLDAELLHPLLISLHGSNFAGGAAALACWGDSFRGVDDLIVAAPDAGTAGWGNARAGHERVLSVLRDVSTNWPVDLDRVSLDGGSMGAHGSFFLAMYHPDRWASIAPRCGSARAINMTAKGGVPDFTPAPPLLENLWATPVYLIAGGKDENSPLDEVRITMKRLEGMGAPLVYREFPEGGHTWYGQEDRDVLDFIRFHVRDPYPARVKWTTREPAFGRCSWIEILESTRPLRIEFTHLDMLGQPLEVRKEYDKSVEVDARIDRDRNRVSVQASGVKSLKVWLADEMLDLDKPVEIVVNDARLFAGKVERSIRTALEDCRKRGDRRSTFSASVTVEPTR